jgi:hypothetical protein
MSADDFIAKRPGVTLTERASVHEHRAIVYGMPRDKMSIKAEPQGSSAH